MQKLYFIRHGQTHMNVSGYWSGTTETQLTEEGKKQAKAAGKAARKLDIDLIVSSPMHRTKETATIIAKEIGYDPTKIEYNSLLIERHFGELEGKPWDPDLDMDGIADIESVDTLLERSRLALEWLYTLPAKNILVVSHGSFGRALRSLLMPEYPFEHPARLQNAEINHWV